MTLPLVDLEKLRTFYVSAKTGKFSIAAQELGMDNSAVTRQIQTLERDLNCTLFERGGFRGLRLTEKGKILQEFARDLFLKVAKIEPALDQADNNLEGTLRIWVHAGYTLNFICDCLDEFVQKYPLIKLDVISSYDSKDVLTREVDIAIGPNVESSDDLIDRELFSYTLRLYASKKYVEKYGMPKSVTELRRHRFISGSTPSSKFSAKLNWYLELEPGHLLEPYFTSNSNMIINKFIDEGIGIGSRSPEFFTEKDVDLVEILPEIAGPELTTRMVYGDHFKNSNKVNTLYDFLLEKSKVIGQNIPSLKKASTPSK